MYSCLRDLVNNGIQILAAISEITEYLALELNLGCACFPEFFDIFHLNVH